MERNGSEGKKRGRLVKEGHVECSYDGKSARGS